MREITILDGIVLKKYDDESRTLVEFNKMKRIEQIYKSLNINGIKYRALKVISFTTNEGYSMEKINGKNLSELFWKDKNIDYYLMGIRWLANYSNSLESKRVPYLSDYTTHNLMLSENSEVVAIDQSDNVEDKDVLIEKILGYYFARFYFELTLSFNLNKVIFKRSIEEYNSIANLKLEMSELKMELEKSTVRLKSKLKNIKSIPKRTILLLALKITKVYLNQLTRMN